MIEYDTDDNGVQIGYLYPYLDGSEDILEISKTLRKEGKV